MSELHIRLRQLRKEQGKTQNDVAEHLSVKRATVSAYEKDKIMPPYEKLKMLSDYFNVSVQYLNGETNFRNRIEDKDPNTIDISESLRNLLTQLQDSSKTITIGDKPIDNNVKELLITTIQSNLYLATVMSKD